jgi:hypothetical protein
VLHHPLALAGVVWWAIFALTLHINTGALWIGLAPTLAVIANYFLSGRRARKIEERAAEKVAEVHTLVNTRSEQQDAKIAELEGRLAELRESA